MHLVGLEPVLPGDELLIPASGDEGPETSAGAGSLRIGQQSGCPLATWGGLAFPCLAAGCRCGESAGSSVNPL